MELGDLIGPVRDAVDLLGPYLEEKGFEVDLVASAGSRENFERLVAGSLDIALVQGGVVVRGDARGVQGIASLFYEPIWVFYRMGEKVELIRDYLGRRIAIGTEGSGSAALARTILKANGIREGFVNLGGNAALEALARREVDALGRNVHRVFKASLLQPQTR